MRHRSSVPGSRAWRLATACLLAAGAFVVPLRPVHAAPVISTAFPGVDVQPGQNVDFPLTIAESGNGTEIVSLRVGAVPQGWRAQLEGGGYEVDQAYINKANPQSLSLNVNVPAAATAGTYDLSVVASGPGGVSTLPLRVRVATGGQARPSLTAQYPELQGASKAKFQFQLTLNNNGFRDESFALSAHAPQGWQVDFTPAYASKEIGAIPVKAGNSQSIDVNVTPPNGAAAGKYTVVASAAAGPGQQVSTRLHVTLVGSYDLQLTTPSGRLNAAATAGGRSAVPLLVANAGTAPVRNISLAADAPSGWNVAFRPDVVATLAPGASQQVTMSVDPSAQAIAGDYDVAVTAASPAADAQQDIRVSVSGSTLWGWIGVLIVLGVLAGLGYLFRRLGRR